MKRTTLPIVAALLALGTFTAAAGAEDWTAGMKEGKPTFKSMGPLAFGPDGILFIADTKSAAITALATGETGEATAQLAAGSAAKPLKVEGINQKVAAMLGASADQVLIDDMAVSPASRNVYLAVSRGRGPDAVPVLVRVKADGQPEVVALDNVKFSRAELPDAPTDGVVTQGRRQSNPRQEAITDLAFFQDRVIIAGLANEEFASTLRAVPFPFQKVANGTTVEIYHGAHGAFETRSPVRTLVPINIGNEPSILAAYTCTPLVKFPVKALEPGAKIKGKTIAELGNRNRPLDMIVYEKDGKEYLLLANSSRGVMKISTEGIDAAAGIEAPVRGGGQQGLSPETVKEWTGVEHLDRLDKERAVVLKKAEGGAVTLEALPLP
jgi:hypothetical protein